MSTCNCKGQMTRAYRAYTIPAPCGAARLCNRAITVLQTHRYDDYAASDCRWRSIKNWPQPALVTHLNDPEHVSQLVCACIRAAH